MVERHSLNFPTEIGSLKIEIENDLDFFKDQKKNSSDHYYVTKLNEIKSLLLSMSEEKKWNDIIWKNIKFKTIIGTILYLYQRNDGSFFGSIISPEEWDGQFMFIDQFILTSENIWKKFN